MFRSWFGLLWSAAVTISASLQFPTGTTANLWDALGANRYVPISLPGIMKGLASLLRQTSVLLMTRWFLPALPGR
jgi:hypothetical protein